MTIVINKTILKYPCPIEKDLDKIRDRMWKEAGRNSERFLRMIKEDARKVVKEYQLDSRTVKPR